MYSNDFRNHSYVNKYELKPLWYLIRIVSWIVDILITQLLLFKICTSTLHSICPIAPHAYIARHRRIIKFVYSLYIIATWHPPIALGCGIHGTYVSKISEQIVIMFNVYRFNLLVFIKGIQPCLGLTFQEESSYLFRCIVKQNTLC